MCTLGFRGSGYSESFVQSFAEIAEKLRKADGSGDAELIRVEAGSDTICSACPNRRDRICSTEERVSVLDEAHAAVLGISTGETITWGEAKRRISEKMTIEKFHAACSSCSWKALGFCETALRKLGPRVLLLFVLLSGPIVWAAPAQPSRVVMSGPIDRVQRDVLKQRKSKAAREISSAFRDLKKKSWDSALRKSRAARRHIEFRDYSQWIEASAQLRLAEAALGRKRYGDAVLKAERAISAYLEILRQSPHSPHLLDLEENLATAELVAGDASGLAGRSDSSLAWYERAFQRLADSRGIGRLRPAVLRRYSEICAKKMTPVCLSWLQKLASTFPKASEETKAITKGFPELLERPRVPRYDRATQAYRSPDRDVAAMDAAMEIYRLKEYGDAAKAFEAFLQEFPRSALRWRARFWLAKALKEEGELEAASAHFEGILGSSPLSYYGMLSGLETGKDPESQIAATLPVASASDPLLQPNEAFSLKRAEQFLAENEVELAALELRRLRVRAQLSSEFLIYLSVLQNRVRNHSLSFSIISELIQRGDEGVASSFMLRLIFPAEYIELIRRHSQENGLDPVLVLSLIKQESAFDSAAISPAGASGLMQLMPATAVDTVSAIRRAELSEGEANIRVGTKYLGQLMKRFNGNIVLSLAGYNAGPGAVDRWMRGPPIKPGMLDFIEAIPYRETRDYVSSIIRNYYWYSRRLEDATQKPIEYFWQVSGPPEVKLISQ